MYFQPPVRVYLQRTPFPSFFLYAPAMHTISLISSELCQNTVLGSGPNMFAPKPFFECYITMKCIKPKMHNMGQKRPNRVFIVYILVVN